MKREDIVEVKMKKWIILTLTRNEILKLVCDEFNIQHPDKNLTIKLSSKGIRIEVEENGNNKRRTK